MKRAAPESMSTRDLVDELADNAALLVKRQVELARLEMRAQARRGKTMAELFGAAGLLAAIGLTLWFVAAALAVAAALDHRYWLGALLCGGTLLIVALILAPIGWAKRVSAPFARSRRELGKEIRWARRRLTS